MSDPKHLIGRGRGSKAFTLALREFNGELSRMQRVGVRKYFNKYDARASYDLHKGSCAYCGMPLVVSGIGQDAARFMLHLPLKAGGKVRRENILAVCKECKTQRMPVPTRPLGRIEGYNTFADVVHQLVIAVVSGDEEKIRALKVETNSEVNNFCATLHGGQKDLGAIEPIVADENTVADEIEKIAKADEPQSEPLAKTLKTIQATGQQRVIRK